MLAAVLWMGAHTSAAEVAPAGAATPQLSVEIDWTEFLSRQDAVWERLPTKYGEAPFAGNGLLGTIVFLDDRDKNSLGFEIGRSDVFDHRDRSFVSVDTRPDNLWEYCRLPIGRVLLKPTGKILSGTMRMDLRQAELRGTLATDAGEIRWRTLVPSDEKVIVIEVETTDGERDCSLKFRPEQGNAPSQCLRMIGVESYVPNPEPVKGQLDGCDLSVQPLLAGGNYVTACKEIKVSPTRRLLYVSVGYTQSGTANREAVTSVNSAIAKGLEQIEADHRQWWQRFYAASFLSIPDARLESFYWIQLYKMASATRADRVVLDLLGPWYKNTNFPCLWMDLNIQLCYFPQYAANHLDLGESLFRLLDRDLPNLIDNAPAEFRDDSAFLGGVSDLSLKGNLVHMLGEPNGVLDLIALPWCAHNYYMHYRFSMDDDMLRWRVYPLMRRAISLYLHYLEEGPDGKLHLPITRSCEYGWDHDTNQDLSLLRWGCKTLISICERLKLDDPYLPRWRDVVARLTPYPTDENGLRIGRDEPFRKSHRHYSHLLAIFPLYDLNIDQPENVSLIGKSVTHWINLRAPLAHTGYTYTGAASLFASMADGTQAAASLNHCLDQYITPNTMYIESDSPCMESPISGARSIQDMVIQSWGNTIRVFPAIPQEWKDVTIHNMRTEGAFLVTAKREAGVTKFVQVTSLAGEPFRLKTDLPDPLRIVGNRDGQARQIGKGLVELNLFRGESLLLYSGDQRPDTSVRTPKQDAPGAAPFGLKKQ